MVENLNTLDAGFLMAEDADRNVSLAIGGIAIIDGSAPNYEKFKRILAERIKALRPEGTFLPKDPAPAMEKEASK